MANGLNVVLIIGSAPDAVRARNWDLSGFSACVVINNAWQIREDWDFLIYADDFPVERRPTAAMRSHQSLVTSSEFVGEQNRFGGFVYAGGTRSYTTGYWALGALKPDVIAYLGCDMVYPKSAGTNSHFYGQGQADPLRPDVTLQSLEAKSVRFMALAQAQQCAVVNLSDLDESRLMFPRWSLAQLAVSAQAPDFFAEYAAPLNAERVSQALQAEAELGYMVPSGRYWEVIDTFDKNRLSAIDALWLQSLEPVQV